MLPEEPTFNQEGPLTLLKVYGADPPLTPPVTLTVEIPVYMLPDGISKPMLLKLKDPEDDEPPDVGGVVSTGVVVPDEPEEEDPTCPTLIVMVRLAPVASITWIVAVVSDAEPWREPEILPVDPTLSQDGPLTLLKV